MVVKADGTKWACLSCLKGHRTTSCSHTDRELQLVPKKGRPVTQCQHCRQERKKKSAHVKCECGEEKLSHPKEKCIHLREADERAKATEEEIHQQGCCCQHGGECNCHTKKDNKSKDKDRDQSIPRGPAVIKPKLETTKSDSSITVFQNGHHKPVHHRNHAAHECGMPYKKPVPRSHAEQSDSKAIRRSVDSLALDGSMGLNPSSYNPQGSAPFNVERRMSKSEQPSPAITPLEQRPLHERSLTAVDFSGSNHGQTYYSTPSPNGGFFDFQADSISGSRDNSYDSWPPAFPSADSAGMPNNNPFEVWPTNNSATQPALTAASSGTQSEVDEVPQMEEMYGFSGFAMPSIQEDNGSLHPNSVPNYQQPNRRSLPPNFFSASDVLAPDQNGEWQSPVNDVANTGKATSTTGQSDANEPWHQDPPIPLITAMPHRSLAAYPAGRPQSQSVGNNAAPNDDIMQQLFPGFDINGNMFATTPEEIEQPDLPTGTDKLLAAANCASPMDFGQGDDEFSSQTWNDGRMNASGDSYTFDFDGSYDSATWSQGP